MFWVKKGKEKAQKKLQNQMCWGWANAQLLYTNPKATAIERPSMAL